MTGLTPRGFIRLYQGLGFSIIPLQPREKKPALDSWKPYQERQATDEEVAGWWPEPDPLVAHNVGIVAGKVSGNLAVVDFDSAEGFRKAFGDGKVRMESKTIVTETSRGVHVYVRTLEPIRNTAMRDIDVDVRGEGGFVVAAPSIHPSGKVYRVMGSLEVLDVDWDEFFGGLLAKLGHESKPELTAGASGSKELFEKALEADPEIRNLYAGRWQEIMPRGYSRSEAEFWLVRKLVVLGFSDSDMKEVMQGCGIGKWQEAGPQYQDLTLRKARAWRAESLLKPKPPKALPFKEGATWR